MADLIQIRRDKASVWQSVNPTLALAEIGIVLDNNGAMTDPVQFKVGDGSTAWNNLPLQNGSAINKIKVNGVEISIDGSRAVDVVVKASGSLGAGISGSNIAFIDTNGVVRNSSINVANTSGSSTSSLMTQAAVSESIADVRKDVTLLSGSVSGSFAAVDERVGNIETNIEENYARIDGSYDSMAVGVAKNLEGNQEVEGAFISRTAGGDAEIANGVAQILEARGNSQKYNQIVINGNFANGGQGWNYPTGAVTFSNGVATLNFESTYSSIYRTSNAIISTHKYYISIEVKPTSLSDLYFMYGLGGGGYFTGEGMYLPITPNYVSSTSSFTKLSRVGTFTRSASGTGNLNIQVMKFGGVAQDIQIKNLFAIDLTLLGIDNLTTVEEVEAWLAENIGPAEYYPYNAGTVLNNSMEGIETIGFNLLDPATGKAQIIGAYDDVYDNLYGITGTHGTITFKAADGTEETITPDADGKFQLTVPGELTVANPGADCAVFLWWDGTKTDYEEYDRNVSYLDVKNIYGKLNGSGSLVQVFPDGLAGVNNIKDVLYVEDGKVVADKLTNGVDLGTLSWTKAGATQAAPDGYFGASIGDGKISSLNVLCSRYQTAPVSGYYRDHIFINASRQFAIVDINYSDASTFKTAMNGVRAVYELATPQHYTDLVYINSSHFADNTPVALPVTFTVDNWGIENILPKNTSESVSTAPADLLCRYAMDAVELLNTHSDQIEDLYEVKADKEGVYPGITAGNLVDVNGVGTEQQFMFRHTGGDEHVADKTQAALQKYMGKSLVWNQLVHNGNFADGVTDWVVGYGTASVAGNILTYSVTSPVESPCVRQDYFPDIANHKYLFAAELNYSAKPTSTSKGFLGIGGYYGIEWSLQNLVANSWFKVAGIVTSTGISSTKDLRFYFRTTGMSVGDTVQIKNVIAIDLTLMFGAGNEPSTVAEFEALFSLPYYEYNAGTIISNDADSIETVGFNQWDESNRVNGYYINWSTGAESPDSSSSHTGYVPVLSNTDYYFKHGGTNAQWGAFYDSNKNYISGLNNFGLNGGAIFHTPEGCAFVRITIDASSVSSTVCINLSDPTKNGTYEPYEKSTTQIGLGEFQVKDSEGNVITVNGLKSAGSVYDEIDPVRKKYVKRIGEVDLGTLDWELRSTPRIVSSAINDIAVLTNTYPIPNALCARYKVVSPSLNFDSENNVFTVAVNKQIIVADSSYSSAATFKTAMSGVMLYYELAEPVEYDLVGSIPETYPVFGGGTEAIEPSGVDEESGVPETAPFRAVIFYSKDYLSQLNSMSQDYISVGSMTNFYTELASKLGAAISKSISVSASYNSSDQKYDYVITISDISGSN